MAAIGRSGKVVPAPEPDVPAEAGAIRADPEGSTAQATGEQKRPSGAPVAPLQEWSPEEVAAWLNTLVAEGRVAEGAAAGEGARASRASLALEAACAAAVANGVSGADLATLADEDADEDAHDAVLARCGVTSFAGRRRLVNAIEAELAGEAGRAADARRASQRRRASRRRSSLGGLAKDNAAALAAPRSLPWSSTGSMFVHGLGVAAVAWALVAFVPATIKLSRWVSADARTGRYTFLVWPRVVVFAFVNVVVCMFGWISIIAKALYAKNNESFWHCCATYLSDLRFWKLFMLPAVCGNMCMLVMVSPLMCKDIGVEGNSSEEDEAAVRCAANNSMSVKLSCCVAPVVRGFSCCSSCANL